jgi:hypothetical protein
LLKNADLEFKMAIDRDHYPYIPDGDHLKLLETIEEISPERWEYRVDKGIKHIDKTGDLINFFEPFYTYKAYREEEGTYVPFAVLMREFMWEGLNIYRPSREYKLLTFNITKPEQIRNDDLVLENEYLKKDPSRVDIFNDVPEWGYQLYRPIEITPERLDLISNININ